MLTPKFIRVPLGALLRDDRTSRLERLRRPVPDNRNVPHDASVAFAIRGMKLWFGGVLVVGGRRFGWPGQGLVWGAQAGQAVSCAMGFEPDFSVAAPATGPGVL